MCYQTILRICISLRKNFSTWIAFSSINKYGKGDVVQLCNLFRPLYHVTCRTVLWNGTFRRLSNHVFQSLSAQKYISFEGHFFWKYSKLNHNFENSKKHSENIFCLWDNCIWKCCSKLSLLRREYVSSAVNGFTNSPRILHIPKSEFFQLNCVHMD